MVALSVSVYHAVSKDSLRHHGTADSVTQHTVTSN